MGREVVLVRLACVLDSQLLISGVALLKVQHQAAQTLCRQGLDLFRHKYSELQFNKCLIEFNLI
jgi:hypothetical protein